MKTLVPRVSNHGLGFLDRALEIAAILELGADSFHVLVELGGVICLCEQIFQEDRVWNSDRFQVLHCCAQGAAADMLIPLETYLAHFHFWAFFDHKSKAHRRGRNRTNLGADRRKLSSMFGKQ